MTLNGGNAGEPVLLTPDRVEQLQRQLVQHADDLDTGACAVCQRHHCPPYVAALARLIASGTATAP